jgi:hypothetical protein
MKACCSKKANSCGANCNKPCCKKKKSQRSSSRYNRY